MILRDWVDLILCMLLFSSFRDRPLRVQGFSIKGEGLGFFGAFVGVKGAHMLVSVRVV